MDTLLADLLAITGLVHRITPDAWTVDATYARPYALATPTTSAR